MGKGEQVDNSFEYLESMYFRAEQAVESNDSVALEMVYNELRGKGFEREASTLQEQFGVLE